MAMVEEREKEKKKKLENLTGVPSMYLLLIIESNNFIVCFSFKSSIFLDVEEGVFCFWASC